MTLCKKKYLQFVFILMNATVMKEKSLVQQRYILLVWIHLKYDRLKARSYVCRSAMITCWDLFGPLEGGMPLLVLFGMQCRRPNHTRDRATTFFFILLTFIFLNLLSVYSFYTVSQVSRPRHGQGSHSIFEIVVLGLFQNHFIGYSTTKVIKT